MRVNIAVQRGGGSMKDAGIKIAFGRLQYMVSGKTTDEEISKKISNQHIHIRFSH